MLPILLALLLAACGQNDAPADPQPVGAAPEAEAKPPGGEAPTGHVHKPGVDDPSIFRPLSAGAGRVFFEAPQDGATVSSPVSFKFGAEGIEIVPAGDTTPNSGHHHLIINGEPIEAGVVVPADDTHIHYGTGAKEAEVPLPAGEHKLTMQLADHAHRSYGPEYAATITLTVTE